MERSAKSYGKGHRGTEKGEEWGLITHPTKRMSSTMLHSWWNIFHTLLNLFFITTLRDSDCISILQVKKWKLRKKKGHAWSHTIIKHKSMYTNFFIQLWVQNICHNSNAGFPYRAPTIPGICETVPYYLYKHLTLVLFCFFSGSQNFIDGKKDQDALNHKSEDLNELRTSKYLACMLPHPFPHP